MEQIIQRLIELGYSIKVSYMTFFFKKYEKFTAKIISENGLLKSITLEESGYIINRQAHFLHIKENPSIEWIEQFDKLFSL